MRPLEPEGLYQRGLDRHSELMPDVFGYYSSEPTQEEHDLDFLMNEYLWGAIWTRPGLDMKSRIVCALARRGRPGPLRYIHPPHDRRGLYGKA